MDEIIINGIKSVPYVGDILLLVLEVLLSIAFSSLIGYQREKRGHGAGLRTHIMVALGACLIMQVSVSSPAFNAVTSRDPARLAAQVVSGIGFLGAGTIIQNGTNIRGLTTAATIWLCGGIGLSCGSGYFSAALITAISAFAALIILSRLEKYITRKAPKIIIIVDEEPHNFKEILDVADHYGIAVKDIHSDQLKGKKPKFRISIMIMPASSEEIAKFSEELQDVLKPEDFSLIRK